MHAVLHEKLNCCRVGAQVCLDAYGCSMAACLRGFGPATTCAASWLQLQRPSTCSLMVHGLLRLHLGRSQASVRMVALWLSPEPGGATGRRRADAAQARRRAAFHAMKLLEHLPSGRRALSEAHARPRQAPLA